MLDISNLSRRFGGPGSRIVLDRISLSLPPGNSGTGDLRATSSSSSVVPGETMNCDPASTAW